MRLSTLFALLLAAGCSGEIDAGDYHGADPEEMPPGFEANSVRGSVADQVGSGCSTAVVLGLSRQIADEIECMAAGALAKLPQVDNISFTGSAVLPLLDDGAVADLRAVGRSRGAIRINSAFRTVAQQYLLYRWWRGGRCGIPAAAAPGRSNHESGRAIDVANWSGLVSSLANRGWSHNVPGDEVHFEHLRSPDARGLDVHAFQRLWNRNQPGDRIAEDGDYGPQTEARLARSPAAGFARGACR